MLRARPPAGLGKLLVVAPDQENAKRYLEKVQGWLPRHQAGQAAQVATSDTPRPTRPGRIPAAAGALRSW